MSAYSDAVLALAPAGYWRLGEPAGTVAVDQRYANHGTYVNTPTLSQTGALRNDPDTAASFARASSERVTLPAAAALHPGDTLSLVFWAKRTGSGAGTTHHIWDNGALDFEAFFDFADKLRYAQSGIATIFVSTAAVTDAAFHMYAFSKAGATIAAYVDGAVMPGTTTNFTLSSAAGGSAIAGTIGAANHYDGTLDEVAIFPTALTAGQVANLYALGIASPSLNVAALADAIAAKYARGTLSAPTGSPTLVPIRAGMATARLPSKVASTPALLIIPESGSLDVGGQDRVGAHTWRALFLYSVTKDYPREVAAVNRWLGVLLNAHLSGNQLGGAFGGVLAEVKTTGYNGPGTITWADGTVFTGAELELSVITTEAWSPTA